MANSLIELWEKKKKKKCVWWHQHAQKIPKNGCTTPHDYNLWLSSFYSTCQWCHWQFCHLTIGLWGPTTHLRCAGWETRGPAFWLDGGQGNPRAGRARVTLTYCSAFEPAAACCASADPVALHSSCCFKEVGEAFFLPRGRHQFAKRMTGQKHYVVFVIITIVKMFLFFFQNLQRVFLPNKIGHDKIIPFNKLGQSITYKELFSRYSRRSPHFSTSP